MQNPHEVMREIRWKLQAIETAIKASKNINTPPTTGKTTGIKGTIASTGSAGTSLCSGVGADIYILENRALGLDSTDITMNSIGFWRVNQTLVSSVIVTSGEQYAETHRDHPPKALYK